MTISLVIYFISCMTDHYMILVVKIGVQDKYNWTATCDYWWDYCQRMVNAFITCPAMSI